VALDGLDRLADRLAGRPHSWWGSAAAIAAVKLPLVVSALANTVPWWRLSVLTAEAPAPW